MYIDFSVRVTIRQLWKIFLCAVFVYSYLKLEIRTVRKHRYNRLTCNLVNNNYNNYLVNQIYLLIKYSHFSSTLKFIS